MKTSSLCLQEQIAYILSADSPDCHLAWVAHQEIIYYSRVPQDYRGPVTAVTKLIQFVFDEKIDHSFFVLRNRIYSTISLSPLSSGMIKLAAKRATGNIQCRDHGLCLDFQFQEMGTLDVQIIRSRHFQTTEMSSSLMKLKRIHDGEQAYRALQELTAKVPRGPVLHDFNRQIAVILCDGSGEILAWGVNSNSKNKTLHAEVLMIQDFYQKHQKILPEGVKIYVSLKPCLMCAAMISYLAPPSCRVFYFEDDAGSLARNSELEKRGMLCQITEKKNDRQ